DRSVELTSCDSSHPVSGADGGAGDNRHSSISKSVRDMPKKPFDRFPTQGQALENARSILWKWAAYPGEPIDDPRDLADIEAMIGNHPNAVGIIGPGVRLHCVMHDDRGSSGFRTIRTDGTVDAWSYRTAITGKYRSDRELIHNALRWDV